MLPQFSLTSSFAASFSTVGPSPALLFLAAGSVLAPLLDSGRRRAQADVEAALRDEAAFAYRMTALQAFADVENELAGIRRLDERRVILARSVQTEIALLRIAKQRYRSGYSAYTDELDAERL